MITLIEQPIGIFTEQNKRYDALLDIASEIANKIIINPTDTYAFNDTYKAVSTYVEYEGIKYCLTAVYDSQGEATDFQITVLSTDKLPEVINGYKPQTQHMKLDFCNNLAVIEGLYEIAGEVRPYQRIEDDPGTLVALANMVRDAKPYNV